MWLLSSGILLRAEFRGGCLLLFFLATLRAFHTSSFSSPDETHPLIPFASVPICPSLVLPAFVPCYSRFFRLRFRVVHVAHFLSPNEARWSGRVGFQFSCCHGRQLYPVFHAPCVQLLMCHSESQSLCGRACLPDLQGLPAVMAFSRVPPHVETNI